MKLNTLLAELERLPHDGRMRRMSELGQAARADAGAAQLVDELAASESMYERMLALQSCQGSGDGALALRMLEDASATIRRRARRLVLKLGTHEQLLAARAILMRGKPGVLDRLAGQALGDAELVALVAAGQAQMAPEEWARLARLQPQFAADALLAQVQAAPQPDAHLARCMAAALHPLGRLAPDVGLALAHGALAAGYTDLPLAVLAQARPNQVAELIAARGSAFGLDIVDLALQVDGERLAALLRQSSLPYQRHLPHLFARLAPAQRRIAYEAASLLWRGDDGSLPATVVGGLPADLREPEARRNMALPALLPKPLERLAYAAFLPWPEAQAALAPHLGSPEPDVRTAALTALVGVTRYYPDHLADLLQVANARRNEQDPVRVAMIQALAALPPSRWRVEHLEALGQVIRAALDARDCSPGTANWAARLVLRLLPFHPGWAAPWLATLSRERGVVLGGGLRGLLAPAEVRAIAPALLPVLLAWEPREREQAIFQAARMFKQRLELFPELVALLERLVGDKRGWVAAQALGIIAQYLPKRLPQLVPELLVSDPSWVTQPVVYQFLHRRRQDLLAPFLGQQAYKGRFATGKTRFVLPLMDGFFRWTPGQQREFAKVLTELIDDKQRDTPALFMAAHQLAALPMVPPDALIALASLANPRQALRDTALLALARRDTGDGTPALLDAMGDERARVAIYALRPAMLALPPPRALPLLLGVPLAKVTVAKEVVRLIGELPTDEAFAALLAFDRREGLHRDVRVALLRALWDHLGREEAWQVLERAATAEPALAASLADIPDLRLAPEGRRRLAALLAALLAHPDAQVRAAALGRCAHMPVSDPEQALFAPLLALAASPIPSEWRAAVPAALATYAQHQPDLAGKLARHVLPHRQALVLLVDWFACKGSFEPTKAAASAVLAALAEDPLAVQQQVILSAAVLNRNEFVQHVRRLAATGQLHADALVACANALVGYAHAWKPTRFAAIEAALAEEPDAALRRVALAALVAHAACAGWSAPLRERLAVYRADPAPLVAAAAQFVFPPDA
ncbi:hypothetical protein F8S13_05610 [Chloroflexia bacterium SDU3-3]|nr:hypothetical protein F8S13_05610 [Chloroflexia bacterium SDU3-3]